MLKITSIPFKLSHFLIPHNEAGQNDILLQPVLDE